MLPNALKYYLVIVNILAFILYGLDKQKAVEETVADPGGTASWDCSLWRLHRGASWNAVFPS